MIPYVGGKSYLANWIISNFPADFQKKHYCEVFGGGGWVLFKKEPSYLETYNDLNKHLVKLFTVIRDNYEEFKHCINWSFHSREMYNEAKEKLKDDKFLNDVETALYYAIRQIQSFSGNSESWGYQLTSHKLVQGKWTPFMRRLEIINARLKRVQIECLDFEKLIAKYDSKDTLFYVDPPYVDCEYYYNKNGVNFTYEDHKRLADILNNIKGSFALSYYENKLVRELYKGHRIIKKHTVKHSCGIVRAREDKTKPKSVELLITNY
ncbi:MAG: DNA adenine methylase [Ignavibacteriales bacterium]|nr:MAG: DNA adenine methylase [Ignavibacteriales bacterium]